MTTSSTWPRRSPTRCSTRATCSTRTGPARSKNQSRWQFGVLGPPRAGAGELRRGAGHGACSACCAPRAPIAAVTIHLRFLQLQVREVAAAHRRRRATSRSPRSTSTAVACSAGTRRSSTRSRCPTARSTAPADVPARRSRPARTSSRSPTRPARCVGRIVRRRWPLTAARARRRRAPTTGCLRLTRRRRQRRTPSAVAGKDAAIRVSLIGAHLLLEAHDAGVRLAARAARRGRRAPPSAAGSAAAGRCWPARRARPTSCWARRSSCTTTPRSPSRAPGALFDAHRDRRDPHPAGDDDDRRREGRGPGHRPAGRARSSTAATRCRPRTCSSCTASCATRTPRRRAGRRPDIPTCATSSRRLRHRRRALVGSRRPTPRCSPTSTPS